MDRIKATYLIETGLDPELAAQAIAGEQSSGTFVRVPGETDELIERFAARVESVSRLDSVSVPSLPGHRVHDRPYQRAEIAISWPIENFGGNLPVLISTLQGNLYELSQLSGLRLLDVELPQSFTKPFTGPRFGIGGTRKIAGVYGRPLIGTIIKPSVGLSPSQTADRVRQLASAGIDFIKDDELMANPNHSPLSDRVAAVMPILHEHAERSGKKVLYAFNISDELDAAQRHYDKVVEAGGSCVMVSLNSVGLVGVKKLCDRGELPVHGHRNGWGMLNRHPAFGIEFQAYQKLWRLAGVDQIHVNGIANKFWEPDESVVRSLRACQSPVGQGCDFPVLPVVSSGQWGGQAFETYRLTRTVDLLYLAGGGIMAHPDGIAGGVAAIQQAWSGAIAGRTLQQTAAEHAEFRHAVEKFS